MLILQKIFNSLSRKERKVLITFIAVLLISSISRGGLAIQEESAWQAVAGGAWREGVVGQPIMINPIISSNPADEDVSRLIYSTLGELIDNYEVKEDGQVYSLKLKDGLLWSNGESLTSDDVIFTIETIQDPEARSPLRKIWQGVAVERLSELRLSLALPAPYVFFRSNIDRLPIIPVHIFGSIPSANFKLSAYNLEPVGSGPYRFQEFTKRKDGFIEEYHLARNENYRGPGPYIKDFSFAFYEKEETLLKDFRLRKVNGFGNFLPLINTKLPSNAVVSQIATPGYYALFFNANLNPILKEAGLRTALNAVIDKRKIIEEIFQNQAEAVAGPLGRWRGEQETPAEPSLAEAKKTIANLKTKLKQEKIELTIALPKIDFLEKAVKIIEESWLALGVETNIISLSSPELLDNVVKTNNYEILLFGNVLPDPLDLFPFWHSSERFYPGLNLALYKNTKVDNLIEKVRQTEDENKRLSLAKEAENIIIKEKPAIFLFTVPYTYIHTDNLQGFAFTETNQFLTTPAERFKAVNNWHVAKARILK